MPTSNRRQQRMIEVLEERRLLAAQLTVADSVGSASDRTVSFHDTVDGSSSENETFTLTNSGDVDLHVTNYAVAGANAADFTAALTNQTNQAVSTTSFTIAAGDAFTISIHLKPTLTALESATIAFSTDDPGNASVTLNMHGTGLAAPVDTAGNTIATAKKLNTIFGNRTINEFVGDADRQDVYRFRLNRPGTLRVFLNNLSADADIELLALLPTGSTKSLGTSQRAGTSPESITKALEAGTYFVRVTRGFAGANTNYTLTLNTDYAPNTLKTALDVPPFASGITYTDFVGSTDTDDFYRITLAARRSLKITVTHMSADADVELRNAANKVVKSSENSGASDESIHTTVGAGVYYVHVLRSSGDTNYLLSMSAK